MNDTTSGNPADLTDDCAREPIHLPGSVQPHGILFVLRTGTLVIEQVSENSAALLDRSPHDLLGSRFLDLVDPAACGAVEHLVRDAASAYVNPFRVPLQVRGRRVVFDGIAHILPGGITVLELERDPAVHGDGTPTEGLDNYLHMVQRSLAGISGFVRAEEVASLMADEVKRFTGFDRVMVYRFAPDQHGEVIAEAREADMEPYLNLHYPASDIPAQARELYLKNHVRLLQDVSAVPARMVPATAEPLDMSRAVLRSMSPVHVRYLKNMGVAATLTLSLVVEGKLWGLIACHHREPHFVSYAIRATASLYAIVMSAQIEVKQRSLENQQAASARRMALRILTGLKDFADPVGSLAVTLPDFIELFEADGAAVVSEAGVHACDSAPDEPDLLSLRAALHERQDEGTWIGHQAHAEFPRLPAENPTAAGLVAIHFGENDWLLLFRDEVHRKIQWAGDPATAKSIDDQGRLAPRHSFAAWQQTVKGESIPWPASTASLTTEVRSGLMELVRKRNILLERSNQDLRRFAGVVAHEVKNQLQSGIMALSMIQSARAGKMEPALEQIAAMGSKALTGLANFTSELLHFAETEMSSKIEEIDFEMLARETVDQLRLGGGLDGARIEVSSLPRIRGPRTQMHHLLTNLLRNAVIHGRHGSKPLAVAIGTEVHEVYGTVIFVRDNGRGIAPENQPRIFDYFYRGRESVTAGSGIGLAFCAQVIERQGNRIWVESEPGRGATFYFTVSLAPD